MGLLASSPSVFNKFDPPSYAYQLLTLPGVTNDNSPLFIPEMPFNDEAFYFKTILMETVLKTINSIKSEAAGYDGIHLFIFKEIAMYFIFHN